MRRVRKDHPGWNKPSAAEKQSANALEAARIRIDLLDFAGARKALAKEKSEEGQYVLGRLARFDGDWREMEERFAKVKDAALRDDVRVERAHALWAHKNYGGLLGFLRDFPKESNRYTEARYYEGLALFHLGKVEAAQKVWASTIKGCSEDPWVYRADWAYCGSKAKKGRRMFSSSGGSRSTAIL